ncbi:MAG: hypothetical protein ACRDL8_20100, partial [Solirubrobacteraceae bacterium]
AQPVWGVTNLRSVRRESGRVRGPAHWVRRDGDHHTHTEHFHRSNAIAALDYVSLGRALRAP